MPSGGGGGGGGGGHEGRGKGVGGGGGGGGGGVFWGTGSWGTGVEPGTQYTEKVICSGGHG